MSLPDSIQKQLDEAEALEALIAAETEVPDETEPEAEAQAPEVEAVAEVPEPVVAPAKTDDWEQKYKSLEGKFNSQVPKLQHELGTTNTQIKTLTKELEDLKNRPAEPTREVADDEELVGADIVKAAERAARRETAKFQSKLDALVAENTELKQELGHVTENQSSFASNDFFAKLNGQVPDWEQIEKTEQGQKFLLSKIPGTGQSWNDALTSAAAHHNLADTTEIFEELVRRHPELRAPKAKDKKDDLLKQITPGKSKTAVTTEAKKTWTSKEIDNAWASIGNRSVKGEEADQLAIELEAAMQEGRIR